MEEYAMKIVCGQEVGLAVTRQEAVEKGER